LAGVKFSIEFNKIVTTAGVRHEIDVLVKTLPDSPYESVWIFECKNWKRTVGKNEPIIFAEKVNAINANRGIIVARKLSPSAKAQLKLDSRLSFVECTDEFLSRLNNVEAVCVSHEVLPLKIRIRQRGVAPTDHPSEFEWREKPCLLNNKPQDFLSFVGHRVDELVARDAKENFGRYLFEGTHWSQQANLVVFGNGEFCVGDVELEDMLVTAQFLIEVRRRKIISKFELKGQGRAFSFEPIENVIPGKSITIELVEKL